MQKKISKILLLWGGLNLLDLVILKSDESMTNNFSESLAQLCATKRLEYWKKKVNKEMDRRCFILLILRIIVLKETMKFRFICLNKKYKHDFSVAMNYLNVNYGFSLF